MSRLPSGSITMRPPVLRAKPFRRHDRQPTEDDGDVGERERLLIETRTSDARIAVRAIDVVEKTEKDALVAREVGIEHHIEQADVFRARSGHDRDAGQRLRHFAVGVENAQPARQSFGQDDVAARKECQAPHDLQVVDQRRHLEGRRFVIRRASLLGKRRRVVFLFRWPPVDRLTVFHGHPWHTR